MTNIAKTYSSPRARASKVLTIALHFVAVALLFSLPEMFQSFGDRHMPFSLRLYIKPITLIAIFYINYFTFIPLCNGRRRGLWKVIILNIILIALALCLDRHLFAQGPPPDGPNLHPSPARPPEHGFFFSALAARDFVMYILTAALSIFIRMTLQIKNLEKQHNELLVRQRSEELIHLKEQIRPHFLFNALNTIYALIEIDPPSAKKSVHRISQMLRYVLYDTGSATLRTEVQFIESYVVMMIFRFSSAAKVNYSFDVGTWGDYPIAPLIFINLIENAFKHGRTGSPDDLIEISITTTPDGLVTCSTSNPAAIPSASNATQKPGIGLSNLRRRLELLYGANASLEYGVADNKFKSQLTIRLS